MSELWDEQVNPLVRFFALCGLVPGSELKVVPHEDDSGEQDPPLQCQYVAGTVCFFPETRKTAVFDSCAVCRLAMPNNVTFCTRATLPSQPTAHCFLITQEDGRQLYGTALEFFQPVKDERVLQAIKAMQDIYLINSSGDTTGADTNFWDGQEELYMSVVTVLVLNGPYPHFGIMYLAQLLAAAQLENGEQLVHSHLHFLLGMQEPPPGFQMTLQGPIAPISCERSLNRGIPLLCFHIGRVFSIFSVPDVLTIISLLLVESQILLVSNDLHSLTAIAECFNALINPFEWQHVFAPIIPCQQIDLLDAPVPFIMGLQASPEEATRYNLDLPDAVTLVNVDTGELDIPQQNVRELPEDRQLRVWLSKIVPDINFTIDDENRKIWSDPTGFLSSGIISPVCNNIFVFHRDMKLDLALDIIPQPRKIAVTRHDFNDCNESNRRVKSRQRTPSKVSEDQVSEYEGNFHEKVKSRRSQTDVGGKGVYTGPVMVKMYKADHSRQPPMGPCPFPELEDLLKKSEQEHENEMRFNARIQEAFFKYFLSMLSDYHIYLLDNTDNDDNVEQAAGVSFDTVAFLSDRPAVYQQFFSQFVSSQTFTAFTEAKLMEGFTPLSPARVYFDECLQNNTRSRMKNNSGSVSFSFRKVASQLVTNQKPPPSDGLTKVLSRQLPPSDRCAIDNQGCQKSFSQPECTAPASPVLMFTFAPQTAENRTPSQTAAQNRQKSQGRPVSHENVNRQLLHEAKLKVRRLTLAKMGREGFMLSVGYNDCKMVMNQEEQTSVIGLCDLLERVWSHGAKKKKSGSQRSLLWTHLTKYMDRQPQVHCASVALSASGTDHAIPLLLKRPSALTVLDASTSRGDTLQRRVSFGPKVKDKISSCTTALQQLQSADAVMSPGEIAVRGFCSSRNRALSIQLVEDIRRVLMMPEIKSENGWARAFIRLAIEKKLLATYLEQLCDDFVYLLEAYRPYAFLRHEEISEQLIGHFLVLNTVNLLAFSNCYLSTTITYTIVVVSKGNTHPQLKLHLYGKGGELPDVNVMPNTRYSQTTSTNIGSLEGAVVLSRGPPITTRVQDIFIYCDRSETCYRLDINRWVGIDDASTKLVLCVEEVSPDTMSIACMMDVPGSRPSSSTALMQAMSLSAISTLEQFEEDLADNTSAFHIVEKIAESVNYLAKFVDSVQTDSPRSLLELFWGRKGICVRFIEAITNGLKSKRVLRSNRCAWDVIEMVRSNLQTKAGEEEKIRQAFCDTGHFLEGFAAYGKHTKALLFVSEGIRLHCLNQWLHILRSSPAVAKVYNPGAVLRTKVVLDDLSQLLDWCSNIALDVPAPIMGLLAHSPLRQVRSHGRQ